MPRKTRVAASPDSERTDARLLEGIRRSREADFNELYERYFPRVYSYVFRRLRNHADAEEVVQETFTVVFRSIDAYRGRSSLLSWIYGIARNTANNHIRRARTHDERVERAEPELVRAASGVEAYTPEERLNLQRCVEALNDRLSQVARWQAEVFLLRHVENLPIREISRRTRRSNDAVRSSLYRVKRLLLEAVDPTPAAAG